MLTFRCLEINVLFLSGIIVRSFFCEIELLLSKRYYLVTINKVSKYCPLKRCIFQCLSGYSLFRKDIKHTNPKNKNKGHKCVCI